MTDFAALGLSARLLRTLEKQDFTTPTDIQAKAIPSLLEGHDLIGLADTGTGKTAAFLLPLLHRLNDAKFELASGQPRSLILAPTRELAQQIGEALRVLGSNIHLRSAVVYGGAPMDKQLRQLKSGVDILIATPGRLMDHVRRGSVKFDRTETFILDEADRMLDMGFINDVKAIAAELPTPHQTVMFSATSNKSIERLIGELTTEAVRISINSKASVAANVTHKVMHVNGDNKKPLLKSILLDRKDGQTIIFTKTKRGADKLNRALTDENLRSDAIHGDRNQRQRQRTLSRFRRGDTDILIATDVAARGIDVPGLNYVINYDLPMEAESYVHRVGRTGRNGAKGEAISLCVPEDLALLRDVEYLLNAKIEVDAEHEFHQEPPARSPKPAKKKGRGRPQQARRKPQAKRPARPHAVKAEEAAPRSDTARPSEDRAVTSRPAHRKPSQGKTADRKFGKGKPAGQKFAKGKPAAGKAYAGKAGPGKADSGKAASGKPSSGKPAGGKPSPQKKRAFTRKPRAA